MFVSQTLNFCKLLLITTLITMEKIKNRGKYNITKEKTQSDTQTHTHWHAHSQWHEHTQSRFYSV